MRTAYKFRIYPNKQQEVVLDLILEKCRQLWNTALADRRNAWEQEGVSRSYEDQAALLTCSCCGHVVPKTLKDGVHHCPRCGLNISRDRNSSIEIRTLGLRVIAYGESTSGLGARPSKRRIDEVGSSGLWAGEEVT